MENEGKTDQGTTWCIEDGVVELIHINEQYCCELTKDDLKTMLEAMEIEDGQER